MKGRLPFRNTIARRFLLAFALVIVLPVSFAGVYVTGVNERALVESSSLRIYGLLEQIANGINEESKHIALLTAALVHDQDLIDAAAAYNSASGAEEYALRQILENRLSNFFNFTNRRGAVQVFFRERERLIIRNSSFLFDGRIAEGDWYRKVMEDKGIVRILDDFSSYSSAASDGPVLSVAVCPGGEAYRRGVELILVSFNVDYLDTILSGTQWLDGEEVLLLNGEGKIILSNRPYPVDLDEELLAPLRSLRNGSTVAVKGGKKFLVSILEIPQPSWRLAGIMSYKRITAETERFMTWARYGLILIIILFLVYVEVFFLNIIKPLHLVIRTMKRVEKGDYGASVEVQGISELEGLGKAFNTMVAEIARLTSEKEQKERERMRLEIESLRFQINPHFLSNTLNSIRLMAAVSKAESISEMTAALMRVVSDSFSEEGVQTPLGKELENLKSYVHIMKVRYGERFSVQYEIDEATLELRILKMLLQPLVENSILHGFPGLKRKGIVTVRSWREGERLKLEILDNGKGMTPAEIERLFDVPQEGGRGFNRVGIRNVRRRILLNYGPGYGLSVESGPGEWTSVTLTLPLIRGGEEPDSAGAPPWDGSVPEVDDVRRSDR